MNQKRAKLIIAMLLFTPFLGYSQISKKKWKAFRIEYTVGLGASNFLGELGGANQIGTHAFRDLELSQTRWAAAVGFRYKLTQTFGLHTKFTYARLTGDDRLTTEFFRNYRNLSFRTSIYELSENLEISFLKDQVGHRYRLRGVRGIRNVEISAYGFLGVGVFYFNPKGKLGDQWVALQPLGTEGQGNPNYPSRKKYKRIQACVPIGLGIKYSLNRNWSLGLEFGLRYTFTDYIDDVSKTYADLSDSDDPRAPLLADKSQTEIYGNNYSYITEPGQQRGDPRYNDAYMFAVFTLNYKLKTGRVNYPMF